MKISVLTTSLRTIGPRNAMREKTGTDLIIALFFCCGPLCRATSKHIECLERARLNDPRPPFHRMRDNTS